MDQVLRLHEPSSQQLIDVMYLLLCKGLWVRIGREAC